MRIFDQKHSSKCPKTPIKTNNNEGLLSTRQNELITINKTRTRKADENFGKEPVIY